MLTNIFITAKEYQISAGASGVIPPPMSGICCEAKENGEEKELERERLSRLLTVIQVPGYSYLVAKHG